MAPQLRNQYGQVLILGPNILNFVCSAPNGYTEYIELRVFFGGQVLILGPDMLNFVCSVPNVGSEAIADRPDSYFMLGNRASGLVEVNFGGLNGLLLPQNPLDKVREAV